jgi:hypothetical protein
MGSGEVGGTEGEGELPGEEPMSEDVDVTGREVEALGDDPGRKTIEEAGAERLVVALAVQLRMTEVACRVDIPYI